MFTTTAGIHQAGVGRQDAAPGGLIYLPFAASLFGRKEVELSRIGSLSGSEGIISRAEPRAGAHGQRRRA